MRDMTSASRAPGPAAAPWAPAAPSAPGFPRARADFVAPTAGPQAVPPSRPRLPGWLNSELPREDVQDEQGRPRGVTYDVRGRNMPAQQSRLQNLQAKIAREKAQIEEAEKKKKEEKPKDEAKTLSHQEYMDMGGDL